MRFRTEPVRVGDIGDQEPTPEPDPDRIYEQEIERRMEAREE